MSSSLIDLTDVAGANFRTDKESDALNKVFMEHLGTRKRFLPARLAISCSLAITTPLELLEDDPDLGKPIKGDMLFGTGTELSTWVALISQRSGDPDLDVRKLIALVGAHWRRGLGDLEKKWKQSDQDMIGFVRRLAEDALPEVSPPPPENSSTGPIAVPAGEVGEDINSEEKILWNVNGQEGSPHSAIMGGSGTGKTVMAVAVLRAIRKQAPRLPLLAFDFKGDLSDFTDIRSQIPLGEAFDAETIEPPHTPIPLDVLKLAVRDKFSFDNAAMRFQESFSRLKGSRVGHRQQSAILQAASQALICKNPCELRHIYDQLLEAYEEHKMRKDGAIATMKELCQFPLFKPELSPSEFFQRSWIIKLPPNVPGNTRTIVVNLLLDALDQHLNGLVDAENVDGARSLRILCMIDEAHQILSTKLPSLSQLIRMSRSKGGAIMLVSQSPDDFSGEDDDFLEQMGLLAAFSANAKPRSVSRVLGKGVDLTKLQEGEAYIRRRGDQSVKRIKAWAKAE